MLLLGLAAPVPAASGGHPWTRLELTIVSDSATVLLRDPQHHLAWACDSASFTEIPACSMQTRRVQPDSVVGLGSFAKFEVASPRQGKWHLTVRSNRLRVYGRSFGVYVQALVRDASGHSNDHVELGTFFPSSPDSLTWDLVIRSSGKRYYSPGFELRKP